MPTGRHRVQAAHQRRRRVAPSLIIAVIVVAVLAVAVTGYAMVSTNASCSGNVALTVVTGPSEQPLLSDLANKWDGGKPEVAGRCLSLSVVSKSLPDMAAALTRQWDASRDGPRPDVWAPDSSTWVRLAQLRADATGLIPAQQPSIMRSPVVIAMPRPMATALGWPQRQIGWHDLIVDMGDRQLWAKHGHPEWGAPRLGMTGPAQDTAGLSALLSVADNDGDGAVLLAELQQSLTFEREVTTTAATTDDLFAGLRKADQDGSALRYLSAFPAVEHDISDYNQQAGVSQQLVAVYPPEGAPEADHPYLTLKAPWVDGAKRAAAAGFLDYLRSGSVQRSLQQLGYRSYSGKATAALSPANGFESMPSNPDHPVDKAVVVARAVAAWTALSRPSNTLAVIDTSASMAEPVAGTGQSKLALVQQATRDMLPLFGDSSDLGLWSFSSAARPAAAHRVLVPSGPLPGTVGGSSRRTAVTRAIAGLTPSGGTPLYATTLAAYQEALAQWRSGKHNVVILLTDGKNENKGGITLNQLLQKLHSVKDNAKPIRFLTIAYGASADVPALQAISRATGGRTYSSTDPTDLEQVFLSALVSS